MMPLPAQLINRITSGPVDCATFNATRANIRGWSTFGHWVFFRQLVALPVKSILVCGVYHGLDLALLEAAAKEAGKTIALTGVDLFKDEPCADWDDTHRQRKTWKEAGYIAPPSMELARKNAPSATIIQGDSVSVMVDMLVRGVTFDAIYSDTSHDEATVSAEIKAALPLLSPGGILCGDDYSDGVNGASGWGVDKAVQSLLPHHVVLFDRIWLAT